MSFSHELEVCLRSRFTLICVVSLEEETILEHLKALCVQTNRRLYSWDHVEFFEVLVGDTAAPTAKDPLSALTTMEHMPDDAVFVLCDFHQCWHGQPRVVRKLRNLARTFKWVKKSIVITMPSARIPEELRDDAVVFEFPPPGVAELGAILSRLTSSPGVKVNLTP